ncbi:putative nuclear pore complex subunit Nup133 [Cladophialophora carrionii]|uniref:Putative nuclear pore complex subunit Nup133 n=1 Tax=Cladophialophora carrionii TaxID=86049 RepID=A0A1C1CS57_9EURO|nr:putative nuclear pore complex subunit Nup133 [Cladophialophora carrionii]
MFSTDASRRESLRPKRTRPAAGPEDSIKLPQAKRKRSALRRDTFEPLTDASLNEVAGREAVEEKSNGYAVTAVPSRELTLRGAKKPEKRSERAANTNAGLSLSSNDFYAVTQLPALPDQIRNQPGIPYSCIISPEYGYALALTHTDAIIWPYNSSASIPSSRDIVAFKLPFPQASTGDPLPLGTFTAKAANGEPGIVAVSAKSGKIVYWETLSSASAVMPGQTSTVQGSIPGMASNEVVEELVNAEPAGFILSLSHGRVIHLTIRDQMGRPGIGVQFLRKYTNATSGFFGSIRNVFGADRRKGVPIVKAGGSKKGQRDVVIATEDGELEFWSTNLLVGNSLEKSFSFREDALEALRPILPDVTDFKILDVELSAGPSTAISRRDSHGNPMMALLSTTKEGETRYFIIEMLVDQEARIKVVHPVSCYSSSTSSQMTWRPRLCVSRNQPAAFILFESAIVLFSLVKIRESPSSQLLMERQALPEPFQDCVRFRDVTTYRVLGYALEMSEKQSSVVFAVQGFGIVKMTSRLRDDEEVEVDEADERDRMNAKSKIEQAVFFGTIKQNPLDLNKADRSFSREEIEAAALDITSEILSSSSKHLPKSAPSIDMQMRLRAKALDDLAGYLMSHYPSSISRNTRFQLLLEAEKLAAAQAIWKVQEEIQRKYPQADREMPYLDFTLRALHETRQKYPDPDKGEKDRVRHWLVNSVKNVGHLMSELVSCIPELEPMDVTDPKVVADYLKEAVDLWIASYSAVFKFREDNAALYGLGDEVFKDGVLVEGFPTDIPHPWSSSPEPLRFSQRLIYDICKFLNEWWEFTHGRSKKKKMPTDDEGKPYEGPGKAVLRELAARLPTEVDLFARLVFEESIQAKIKFREHEKDPDTLKDEIKNIDREVQNRLGQALQAVSAFNMRGAIHLGEKLKYYGDLVTMHLEYYKKLIAEAAADPSLAEKNQRELEEMRDRAESYYGKFGKGWAFAAYSQMLIDGECGSLLLKGQEDQQKEEFLTWFFKMAPVAHQQLGKLSWIHDVISNHNYQRAEQTLQVVTAEEQNDVWNKKTELALAKLVGLAADEGTGKLRDPKAYDDGLSMIAIQEQIYSHVMASVGAALDDKAAFDLAQDTFASRVVAKSPALKRQLKQVLKSLLRQVPLTAEELVDLLTLMDPIEWGGLPEEDPEVSGQEFALALRVVDLSGLPEMKQEDLRASIWRRAMVRDDWLVLNETGGKDDQRVEEEMQQSSLFRALEHVFVMEQVEGTPVHLLSPSDILNREAFPASLQDKLAENEIEGIRKDVEKEQARLKSFVEKGRLEDHYGGLITAAQRNVRDMIDAQGEQVAQQALEQEQRNGD